MKRYFLFLMSGISLITTFLDCNNIMKSWKSVKIRSKLPWKSVKNGLKIPWKNVK